MSEPETPSPEPAEGPGAAPTAQPQPATAPGEQSKKRQRPVKVLPTDRVSIQKQKDALKAYASLYEATKGPVTNVQVGSVIGLNYTTTGLMNSFFVDTGLLEKVEGGFQPSEEVKDYLRAIQWEEESPGRRLKPVLSKTWFAQALLPHLSVGPKGEKEALQILAREANAERAYRPHLRILLEFLEFGGLVEREGDMVRATPPERVTPAAKELPVIAERPATEVKPPAFSRTVELASGGTLTVSASIDPFALSQDDRVFVYKFVDDLIAYAEGRKKPQEEERKGETRSGEVSLPHVPNPTA